MKNRRSKTWAPAFAGVTAFLLFGNCQFAQAGRFAPDFSDIVDDTLRTQWMNNVGVEGGIPVRETVYRTFNPGATAHDINIALAACPVGQVVLLTNGTYNLTQALWMNKSGVTLRGQGQGTVLMFTGTVRAEDGSGENGYININNPGDNTIYNYAKGGQTPPVLVTWTGGLSQYSSDITVSDASNLAVDDIIVMDQTDDNIHVVSDAAHTLEGCTECGRSGHGRAQQQWSRITDKVGNTLTISPPVHMPNWNGARTPQVWCIKTGWVRNTGIENLTVDGTNGNLGGGNYPGNIAMNQVWNCWLDNVWSRMGQVCHVKPYGGGRITIRHCTFYGSKTAASLSYGIMPYFITGALIENNSFDGVDGPLLLEACVTGCVLAYNYVTNVLFNNPPAWMDGSITTHGGHNCMNLYEGNYIDQLGKDNFHGGSSHETIFRNRITGSQSGKSDNLHPIVLWAYNHYINLVGNILGSNGPPRTSSLFEISCHNVPGCNQSFLDAVTNTLLDRRNFNFLTGTWNNSTGSTVAPPVSLYISGTAAPTWFGNLAFPPFDSSNGATISTDSAARERIPAGYRYVHGQDPAPGGLPPPPSTTHPGDNDLPNPGDHFLTLDEVTEYNACWRSLPNPLAGCPSILDVNYASRAGMLYKTTVDGVYHYDATVQSTLGCPVCWIPGRAP